MKDSLIDTPTVIELTVKSMEHKVQVALSEHMTGINEAIKKRVAEVCKDSINMDNEIEAAVRISMEKEIQRQSDLIVREHYSTMARDLLQKAFTDVLRKQIDPASE